MATNQHYPDCPVIEPIEQVVRLRVVDRGKHSEPAWTTLTGGPMMNRWWVTGQQLTGRPWIAPLSDFHYKKTSDIYPSLQIDRPCTAHFAKVADD